MKRGVCVLNKEKFDELFGFYGKDMQSLILRQLYDPARDNVFGLDRLEANALRTYLGIDIKLDFPIVVHDASRIPPMAKVSRKLMAGVMKERYLLEIDKAYKELEEVMDVNDISQLNVVSKHTTGELMDIYGLAAYPLLQLAKKNNIYPLPDLSPRGSIRPFVDVCDANMSEHITNALRRATRKEGRHYSGNLGNITSLIAMDDEDILKVRGVGMVRIEEIRKIRDMFKICYPEHYKRLEDLSSVAADGKYCKPGSFDEFNEFKIECELRKLMAFDSDECLIKIEDYTPSELRSIFGDMTDILESKCATKGIYPLPEFDQNGDVTRKYEISSVENIGGYIFEKSARDIKYVHQLFELNDNELSEWLGSLSWMYRDTASSFVERVKERYPNHVARLKDERSKRCDQKRIGK